MNNGVYVLAVAISTLLLFAGLLIWVFSSRPGRLTEEERSRRSRYLAIRHMIAAIAGVACFAIVFTYTGDADLMITVSSGLLAASASYLAANIALAFRNMNG